jgi:hypothetical protein
MDPRIVALAGVVTLAILSTAVSSDDSSAGPCGSAQATPTNSQGTPEALPDLVVADTRSDRTWEGRWAGQCWKGDPLYSVVDVQIENRGVAPAGHFLVRGEESMQTPVVWDVSGFAAGEARWLGEQRGAAHIVVVDPDDEVRESDESNNRITRAPTSKMTEPPTCTPTPRVSLTPTPAVPPIHTPTPTVSPTPTPAGIYLPAVERPRLQ